MNKVLFRLVVFLWLSAFALSSASSLSIQHLQAQLLQAMRTAHPPNNLLAQEASAVTYNWDTNTLFVVGDGGTSVTQVTKTGQLIDSMTLAPGTSPQGTDFYNLEGVTYIGGGRFVLVEERDRQASLLTYRSGGSLRKADV